MSYDLKELQHYKDVIRGDLIPCHPWNKRINGIERGKTPLHNGWTSKEYPQTQETFATWASTGYNIAYRVPKGMAVIDIDPKNFNSEIDSKQEIAKIFEVNSFDDLLWDVPAVKTGGGGHHIYCTMPKDVDVKSLRRCVQSLPGVDFKFENMKVVAAGSKHPNGNRYYWDNRCEPIDAPKALIELLTREISQGRKYKSGSGAFTGAQLYDAILSKLDPLDYSDNDSWLPIMMASHHATNGEGLEEFLMWSLSDPEYSECENIIRLRWESVYSDQIEDGITVATLIHELKKNGQDTKKAKAILEFESMPDFTEVDAEETEESHILAQAQKIGQEITAAEVYSIDTSAIVEKNAANMASELAKRLTPNSSKDDVMQCIRAIKVADILEREEAINTLIEATRKKYSRTAINKILKELDATISQDLAAALSNKALEEVFNNKKHILVEPNEGIWIYNKTHWIAISSKYLEKVVRHTLNGLRKNLDIKTDETSLIKKAAELTKMEAASLKSKLYRTEAPRPIIGCKNCEIHIANDGSHTIKEHSYKSYLTRCLNTTYDPAAKAPLFLQTLHEIFAKFPDADDMIRHIAEIFGYLIQPYKNLGAWWLFLGPGGDGKTTLMSILEGILGDAFTPARSSLVNAKNSDKDNHGMTSLVGALAVVIGDFKKGAFLDDELMKDFADNKAMETNPKHKDKHKFMYSAGLVICSNHIPKATDSSRGFIRRVNVVPFNAQFNGEKADLDRKKRILEDPNEVAGVLNFMLEGLQRLRNRGQFDPPKSCRDATELWLAQANNAAKFISECVRVTGDPQDCLGELSNVYGTMYALWCEENEIDAHYRMGKLSFKEKLIELGLAVKRGHGNIVKVYGAVPLDQMPHNVDDF